MITPIPEKNGSFMEVRLNRTNMAPDQVDLTELLQGTFLVLALVKKRWEN